MTERFRRGARKGEGARAGSRPADSSSVRRVVVACRIFRAELEQLASRVPGVELRFLDQSLHRTPHLMADLVQAEVERAARADAQVVLGYGLCSNGIVGVVAPERGLVVPRAHDCITLFLGSPGAYRRAFRERPGTYYLTPGWVAEKKDPLGVLEDEYVPRVGREDAEWALREELKHYTHIALIHSEVVDVVPIRRRARENAAFLGKAYEEIGGSLEYFEQLLRGPYGKDRFLVLGPGERVTQEMFLD